MTYSPKQRVRILTFVGPTFERDWSTQGTVQKPRSENLPLPNGYHVVRFDDGAKLCVPESRLMADNEEANHVS